MARILVTGGTGLIGRALVQHLRTLSHEVHVLSRRKRVPKGTSEEGVFHWDPTREYIDKQALLGIDAMVHLAGENIVAKRWTQRRKQKLRDSRVHLTAYLRHMLSTFKIRPQVLVCASAIGLYDPQTNKTPLREDSPAGRGFIPDLVRAWEEEAIRFETMGVRVVRMRIGMVLSPAGGFLPTLLPPLRAGLGVVPGKGTQTVNWIHLADLCNMIASAIADERWTGAYNAVAPHPVTYRLFLEKLAAHMGRKVWMLRFPLWLLRLVFGEMADLLFGPAPPIHPSRALEQGFRYAYPNLEKGWKSLLAGTTTLIRK